MTFSVDSGGIYSRCHSHLPVSTSLCRSLHPVARIESNEIRGRHRGAIPDFALLNPGYFRYALCNSDAGVQPRKDSQKHRKP
jgi:hypothetical protein